MKGLKKQRNVFIWIDIISLIVVILFTYLQMKHSDSTLYAIINNISICILTGGMVTLVQSIIAFNASKHNLLLEFYKNACAFDGAIIHYASTTYGFSHADQVVEKIHNIITFFECTVKSSYMMLDSSDNKKDEEVKAAGILFSLFLNEAKQYRNLEDILCEGIRFMKASEVELLQMGIKDIEQENKELNAKVQDAANRTVELYNNENTLKERKKAFETLENYLFLIKK